MYFVSILYFSAVIIATTLSVNNNSCKIFQFAKVVPLVILIFDLIDNKPSPDGSTNNTKQYIKAALICGSVGDFVVELSHIWGGLCFIVGHMFYIASFGLRNEEISFVVALIAASAWQNTCLYFANNARVQKDKYIDFIVIYSMFVCAMAVGALHKSFISGEWQWVVGGFCFVLSDFLFAHHHYIGEKRLDWAFLPLYWIAQFCFWSRVV